MSRQERHALCQLQVDTVKSPEFLILLTRFSDFFKTCAGPAGKLHMVRNASRGHLTLSGSCGRLLSAMMLSREEFKLIASAVQAHIQRHSDGGLFFITLCTQLILASAQSDVNPSILTSLYAQFVDIIISYLNSTDCKMCVKADFSELSVLLKYVKSVLRSKSLLSLCPLDCDHLSQLLVKTFLESIPSELNDESCNLNSDGVFYLTLDNLPTSDCKLEQGLLLRYPNLMTIQGPKELPVIRKPPTPKQQQAISQVAGLEKLSSVIRVALFTCSLSGDFEETADCHYELSQELNAHLEGALGVPGRGAAVGVLDGAVEEKLESLGVGLVLCQRVVHPSLKAALRARGILCVDRLGGQPLPYLQDLTCGQPVSSVVDLEGLGSCLGWLTSLEHVILGGKSFLWLQRPCPVTTLVLCATLEEQLQELKVCVRAALQGLTELARCKTLLPGAGCWQAHCAQVLQHKVLSELADLAKYQHCSQVAVLQALSMFRGSLHAWPHSLGERGTTLLMDLDSCHIWREPHDAGKEESLPSDDDSHVLCCCGLKAVATRDLWKLERCSRFDDHNNAHSQSLKNENESMVEVSDSLSTNSHVVFDSFSCSIDALRHAVTTAGLVLSISQFISDRN